MFEFQRWIKVGLCTFLALGLTECRYGNGVATLYGDVSVGDCASDTDIETIVCAADAFLDTLSTSDYSDAIIDWDDSEAKTIWTDDFDGDRNGLVLGDLKTKSVKAAVVLARAVLSDQGFDDFIGVLAAEDYIGETEDDDDYTSYSYAIGFIGEPSVSGEWMLQIGGHNMAYNITFLSGTAYPVPTFIGTEPTSKFYLKFDSNSYHPMDDKADAMTDLFESLSSTALARAYLDDSYSDVLIGPDDGSAELPDDYPEDSDREGILVSNLTSTQQALVTAAIEQWVNDYAGDIADDLLEEYTSESAYEDTYIAWAGDEDDDADLDEDGTYVRIDGPRLWIELIRLDADELSDESQYHSVFRDKTMDYGNSL